MMQSQDTLSLPLLSEDSERNQTKTGSKLTTFTEIVLAFAVPVLLFVEFAIATPHGDVDHTTINTSIVIFFLASVMYRTVLSDHIDTAIVVHLIPEAVCLLTIAAVWYSQRAFIGFLCMSFGTIVMSLTVAWNSTSVLLSEASRTSLLSFLMTLALPLLIYGQYCIAVTRQNDVQGLTSFLAQTAAAGFLVVSLMFRKILEDERIESTLVHTIPELVGVSTILLLANGAVAAGFYVLVISEGLLAVTVAVYCVRYLLQQERVEHAASTDMATTTKTVEV